MGTPRKGKQQMKKYPNTLLGYFKAGLAREGESTKYFNRDFLAVYLREYAESKKAGRANYPETKKTRFYNDNSCAYCVFLELHYEYEKGMEKLRAVQF